MTVQAHTADRRLVVLAVLGVVLALTAAMWTLAGCAPQAAPSAPVSYTHLDVYKRQALCSLLFA